MNARKRDRVTRDPIYGYIAMPEPLMKIIEHEMFQRLRRISQNSMASYVYPSMMSQRFSHSLGAMHLATEAWKTAWENSSYNEKHKFRMAVKQENPHADKSPDDGEDSEVNFAENISLALGAATLLHDIGHPPFSHALEQVILTHYRALGFDEELHRDARVSGSFHEHVGKRIAIELIDRIGDPLFFLTKALIDKNSQSYDSGWAKSLRRLIDSSIDVDRIDYLLRDNYFAGTEYGAFDYRRIIASTEIHSDSDGKEFVIGLGSRARSGAEQMLLQRSQTYRWVLFHPRVVASDFALAQSVDLLVRLASSSLVVTSHKGHELSVADIFTKLMPNMNYMDSSPSEYLKELGLDPPSGELPRLSEGHHIYRTIRNEMRASVDDAAVMNWVRSGVRSSHAVLATIATGTDPSWTDMKKVTRFGRAAMYRSKELRPVWKNFEEYQSVADRIINEHSLYDIIDNCWNTFLSDEARQAWSYEDRDTAETARSSDLALVHAVDPRVGPGHRRDSVQILNRLASLLVGGDNLADRLDYHKGRVLGNFLTNTCGEPIDGIAGFWEATYRDFEPLKSRRLKPSQVIKSADREGSIPQDPQEGSLFLYQNDRRISLEETSPLVQSLEWVDRQRMKLFVFFCREHIEGVVDPPSPAELRRKLQDAFVSAFPRFVADHYMNVQGELIAAELAERERS